MIDTVIKGIVIGLFISIPLGPIGMLCIQRTLSRGRKYGIATGLGATSSDLLYTLVTLFFLSFVVDVIEQHELLIQIGGSIILIGFGLFTFLNHPATHPQPNEKPKYSLFSDYFTSLALTLSNPFVLFVLIALFARFEFITDETTVFMTIWGILSILAGAFLWWSVLTFLVSRFRTKLNRRGLRIINQITGLVIVGIGVVGVVLALIKLYN